MQKIFSVLDTAKSSGLTSPLTGAVHLLGLASFADELAATSKGLAAWPHQNGFLTETVHSLDLL